MKLPVEYKNPMLFRVVLPRLQIPSRQVFHIVLLGSLQFPNNLLVNNLMATPLGKHPSLKLHQENHRKKNNIHYSLDQIEINYDSHLPIEFSESVQSSRQQLLVCLEFDLLYSL